LKQHVCCLFSGVRTNGGARYGNECYGSLVWRYHLEAWCHQTSLPQRKPILIFLPSGEPVFLPGSPSQMTCCVDLTLNIKQINHLINLRRLIKFKCYIADHVYIQIFFLQILLCILWPHHHNHRRHPINVRCPCLHGLNDFGTYENPPPYSIQSTFLKQTQFKYVLLHKLTTFITRLMQTRL